MTTIKEAIDKLKSIDAALCEELEEVSDFESELYFLEYELDEEEKLVAKLHNSCQVTIRIIKDIHSLIRKIHTSANDKTILATRALIKIQLDHLDGNMNEVADELKKLEIDEKAGEKIVIYCEKVESLVRRKLSVLRARFEEIEKNFVKPFITEPKLHKNTESSK